MIKNSHLTSLALVTLTFSLSVLVPGCGDDGDDQRDSSTDAGGVAGAGGTTMDGAVEIDGPNTGTGALPDPQSLAS